MRTSRDPTYVNRKRHNTYILLMPSVTCGPPFRAYPVSHDTYIILLGGMRAPLVELIPFPNHLHHSLSHNLNQERFLPYTCLLIYLGSGVEPISGKLHSWLYLIIAERLTYQSTAYHACFIILDHVQREYTSRLNLHKVHTYILVLDKLFQGFTFLLLMHHLPDYLGLNSLMPFLPYMLRLP
jgi:hypothetical protein